MDTGILVGFGLIQIGFVAWFYIVAALDSE